MGNSPSGEGVSPSPNDTEETRARIADVAEGYVGSDAWALDKRKDDFPAGTYKCNKFVHDVLEEAGAPAPTKSSPGSGTWPLQAGDWASKTSIDGYERLPSGIDRDAGDVIAKARITENATGHVAIVANDTEEIGACTMRVERGDHGFGDDATVWRYAGKSFDPDPPIPVWSPRPRDPP